MFLSGVQFRIRLDSRLKHAGMTDFGWGITVTQQAAGNRPTEIEIYKGRPIFYSLGNFIFQNETVGFFPADAYERFDLDSRATPADFLDARTDRDTKGHPGDPLYWENIVARCHFREKKLAEVRLYPIDQGHGRPRGQRGRPLLAEGEVGNRVLQRVQRLSRLHGTEVEIRGGVGLVRL